MLRFLLRESRTRVVLCGFFSLGSGGANGLLLVIISEVIADQKFFSPPHIAAFFALVIISQILRYAANVTIISLVEKITIKTRLVILDALRESRVDGFEKIGHAGIHNVLTNDCTAISRFIPDMIELVTASITITVCMMYLFFLSRLVFFLVLLTMTLGTLLYLLRQQSAKTNLEQSRSQLDKTYKLVLDFLNGFKELKLNPEKGNDLFCNHIRPGFDQTRKLLVKSSQIVQLNYSLGLTLFFSLLGLVLFYLPHHFPDNITVIPKIAVVVLYLVAPGGQFLYSALQFINLRVAMDNLESLKTLARSEKEEKTSDPSLSGTFDDFSVIRLRDISYSYMGSADIPLFTAGPMSIDIQRGKLILITGGNGDGKTTLCKLITGLYFPGKGYIQVDDSLVSSRNIDQYRNLFSAVFSDFYLFERLYGIKPVNSKEVDLWLERFHLSHKLTLDQGIFSSRSLSSGQKRRLALLCALMEKRPILVCDEMTADQEPEFREYFYKIFIPEMKSIGKTIIIITHDDRYFHLADQMVKLNYGVRIDPETSL